MSNEELASIGLTRRTNGETDLIDALKKHNRACICVKWMQKPLSRNQIRETYQWINNYSESGRDGHLTSTCDPFLCLLCELFGYKIIHSYRKNKITYSNTTLNNRYLNFESNNSHFKQTPLC